MRDGGESAAAATNPVARARRFERSVRNKPKSRRAFRRPIRMVRRRPQAVHNLTTRSGDEPMAGAAGCARGRGRHAIRCRRGRRADGADGLLRDGRQDEPPEHGRLRERRPHLPESRALRDLRDAAGHRYAVHRVGDHPAGRRRDGEWRWHRREPAPERFRDAAAMGLVLARLRFDSGRLREHGQRHDHRRRGYDAGSRVQPLGKQPVTPGRPDDHAHRELLEQPDELCVDELRFDELDVHRHEQRPWRSDLHGHRHQCRREQLARQRRRELATAVRPRFRCARCPPTTRRRRSVNRS